MFFLIAVISIFLTGVSSTILVPPKTPTVSGNGVIVIGSRLQLDCDGEQDGAGKIQYSWWLKSSRTTPHKVNEQTNGTYVIKSVSESDTGKYMCQVRNEAGTRRSVWKEVLVYTPCPPGDGFSTHVSPAFTKVGGSLTLYCSISNPTGQPVTWTKQDSVLSLPVEVARANASGCLTPSIPRYSWGQYCSPAANTSEHFHLHITNAEASDTEYWTCQDAGINCKSDPVLPVIQVPPGPTSITGFPTKPVVKGDIVHLKCASSNPSDSCDWFKDAKQVMKSSSTYDFIVKKESSGVYHCVASNRAGSETSSNRTLEVYYKPENVIVSSRKNSSHVGKTASFVCNYSGGYPSYNTSIYFKRIGDAEPKNVVQGQEMVVKKEDNLGEYFCVARVSGFPSLNMSSKRKKYNVTFPSTKVSFTADSASAVREGQLKIFSCVTNESNPVVANIEWSKLTISGWEVMRDNVTKSSLIGPHGGRILISTCTMLTTKEMHGWLIRCKARNSIHGLDTVSSADAFVNVMFGPSELTMTSKPKDLVSENQEFNVTCQTGGANPAAEIQFFKKRSGGNWAKMNNVSSNVTNASSFKGFFRNSTLHVKAHRQDDQCLIMCQVNNGHLNLSQTTLITVFYAPKVQLIQGPSPVKEGNDLTLICDATGGNPKNYSYKWNKNAEKVENATVRELKMYSVNCSQSGLYQCEVTNSRLYATVKASLDVQVHYAAKLNPVYPQELLTAATKPYDRVEITVHILAFPQPSDIHVLKSNNDSESRFNVTEVDDRKLILTLASVEMSDFGEHRVMVENNLGVSTFILTILKLGQPYGPTNLRLVNRTAVSASVAFDPGYNGGSEQNFHVEIKEARGKIWSIYSSEEDSRKSIVLKVRLLKESTDYNIRVKAQNQNGTSRYGRILRMKTKASPKLTHSIKREKGRVTINWTALPIYYTKMEVKACPRDIPIPICQPYVIKDQMTGQEEIYPDVKQKYYFYLEVFDGDDLVYRSEPMFPTVEGVLVTTVKPEETGLATIGLAVGFSLSLSLGVALVAVIVVLSRRMVCHKGNDNDGRAQGDIGVDRAQGDIGVAVDRAQGDIGVVRAQGDIGVAVDRAQGDIGVDRAQGDIGVGNPVGDGCINPGHRPNHNQDQDQDPIHRDVEIDLDIPEDNPPRNNNRQVPVMQEYNGARPKEPRATGGNGRQNAERMPHAENAKRHLRAYNEGVTRGRPSLPPHVIGPSQNVEIDPNTRGPLSLPSFTQITRHETTERTGRKHEKDVDKPPPYKHQDVNSDSSAQSFGSSNVSGDIAGNESNSNDQDGEDYENLTLVSK